jgi:hypothetical protein
MVSARHLLCSTTRVPHRFQPIAELQETQHPGNAGLNLAFREIQLVCDFAVTQASTYQPIDRKKDTQSFPIITHYAPTFSHECVALMERDLAFWKEHVYGVLLGQLNSLAPPTGTMIDDGSSSKPVKIAQLMQEA